MKEIQNAIKLAAEAKEVGKNFYLGCIVKRRDGAYVYATNNTLVSNKCPSAHAEARALRKADFGAILWVARVLKDGKTWAMAMPCKNCQALIKNKGVRKVYYTTGHNEWEVWIPN